MRYMNLSTPKQRQIDDINATLKDRKLTPITLTNKYVVVAEDVALDPYWAAFASILTGPWFEPDPAWLRTNKFKQLLSRDGIVLTPDNYTQLWNQYIGTGEL